MCIERQQDCIPTRPKLSDPMDFERYSDNKSDAKNKFKGTRSRGWVFTLYHDSLEEIQTLSIDNLPVCLQKFLLQQNIRYSIVGLEVCPKTQRRHLQGYFYAHNPINFESIKHQTYPDIHLEKPRRGIKTQIKYCSKDSNFISIGSPPDQGHRSDLNEYITQAQSGIPAHKLALKDPFLYAQYHNGIDKLLHYVAVDKYVVRRKCCIYLDYERIDDLIDNSVLNNFYCYDKNWPGYTGCDYLILPEIERDFRFFMAHKAFFHKPYGAVLNDWKVVIMPHFAKKITIDCKNTENNIPCIYCKDIILSLYTFYPMDTVKELWTNYNTYTIPN